VRHAALRGQNVGRQDRPDSQAVGRNVGSAPSALSLDVASLSLAIRTLSGTAGKEGRLTMGPDNGVPGSSDLPFPPAAANGGIAD
jgi:hypothetical protein